MEMRTTVEALNGDSPSTTLRDVAPAEFIEAYAAHLKRSGDLKVPEWAEIVKTGVRKELAPYREDWFFVRAAAIARKIYLRQGLGVAGLARVFGGAQRRGTRALHFKRDARGLIRYIINQLETLGIVEKLGKGGRRITSAGRKDLDRIAHSLSLDEE